MEILYLINIMHIRVTLLRIKKISRVEFGEIDPLNMIRKKNWEYSEQEK